MKHPLSLALLCLLVPLSTMANSSTAGFSNEGLKLLKSEKIRMASEDLFVSTERIRVRYTFENLSSEPIKTLVAFPFPQVDALADSDVSEVSQFTLTIGGARQETRRETLYLVKGEKVDKSRFDALLDTERARRNGEEGPTRGFTATEQHLEVWTQEFPPGKGLEVEVSYTPSVGGDLGWDKTTYSRGGVLKRFCIDASTTKALDKLLASYKTDEELGFAHGARLQELSYVLLTANNWAGPIGKFHLTVEKHSPETVISTCMNGLKKTSPVRFEFTRENFRPDQDLHVIYLQ